jgi:hypothetical protein
MYWKVRVKQEKKRDPIATRLKELDTTVCDSFISPADPRGSVP